MTNEEVKKSVWSWKIFSANYLTAKNNPKPNIAVSLLLAFFIILASAQILGLANAVYNEKVLIDKYKNVNVVVYSNIA